MNLSRRGIVSASIGAAVLALPFAAVAQDKYPSRPIEVIVPWGPGGGADQVGRMIAKLSEPALKVSMPVINVPGATGQTGLTKLLTAEADGYTISVMTGDTFGLLASSQPKWGLKDFIPLGVMIQQPSAFLVKEGGKFKSWADVERIAKTETVRVAITGFGSPDEMTSNYFVKKGMKLVGVPFAKPGERYASILGDHADVLYEQIGDVRNFVDNKQMKPVIVFADKRDPSFKDVPASVELGHKITLPQFRLIVARAGMDPAKVKLLSDTLAAAVKKPEYVEYLKQQYADANSFVPADKAKAFLENELKSAKALVESQKGLAKPAAK